MTLPGIVAWACLAWAAGAPDAGAIGGTLLDTGFVAESDGTTQHYVILPPPAFDPAKPCDLLIALHGHGSDRWQFAKDPRDECRASRDFAARRGMLFVSPDYRASTSWMGPRAESDLVQILRDLKRCYHVQRVLICGGSMGGTACLTFAALHPDLTDGVVSMNGTANLVEYEGFQEAIRESFGGTKDQVPGEYRKRSAEFAADRLTMPIGITAGGKDESVPAASVLRLAEALKKLNRDVFVLYRPDGGHVTTYDDAMAAFEFVFGKMRARTE